jgi:hypothetical protein
MMKIMLIIHQKAVIHHPPGYSKYRNIFQNLFFNELHPISFHKICSFPYLLQITLFFYGWSYTIANTMWTAPKIQ